MSTALTPVQKESQAAVRSFEDQIVKLMPRIGELLPPRAGDPNRFKRMVIMATVRNPKLLDADRTSLLAAVMNAAELGLSCSGGPASRAHLVPFKGKVTCIPDYKGLVDIALDSGFYDSIEAEVVHANDEFIYRRGLDPKLEHTPKLDGDRGEMIAAYAIAWPKGGGRPAWIVMQKGEIEKIRDGSPGYQNAVKYKSDDNMWIKQTGEAWKKTAIRRLYKTLKTTPDMLRAEEIDTAADTGDAISIDAIVGADHGDPTQERDERATLVKELAEARITRHDKFEQAMEANEIPGDEPVETLPLAALKAIVGTYRAIVEKANQPDGQGSLIDTPPTRRK